LSRQGGIAGNRIEQSGGEGSAESVEQLQEDQADRISLGRQSIAARTRQFLDEAFGAELGEVVAGRAEVVLFHGRAQGGGHVRMDFAGAEGAGRCDLSEAHQGMHYGQLPGIVELEAGNTFAGRGMRRFGEILELPAIDEGLEDILLDVEVVVVDRALPRLKCSRKLRCCLI
jgi:hypothetical protein